MIFLSFLKTIIKGWNINYKMSRQICLPPFNPYPPSPAKTPKEREDCIPFAFNDKLYCYGGITKMKTQNKKWKFCAKIQDFNGDLDSRHKCYLSIYDYPNLIIDEIIFLKYNNSLIYQNPNNIPILSEYIYASQGFKNYSQSILEFMKAGKMSFVIKDMIENKIIVNTKIYQI